MAFDIAHVVRHYGDPEGEVEACRTNVALFDFSFMARGRIAGPEALAGVRRLTDRPISDMRPGQIRYALRADAWGVLVADLTIWREGADVYEVMSGRRADICELVQAAPPGSAVDMTDDTAVFAMQGPRALAALSKLLARDDAMRIAALRYFEFCDAPLAGMPCRIGRLGYTGERGFEVIVHAAHAGPLWGELVGVARPAGFIAADVLRIEAGFVLFANEFRVPQTAAEAGLAAFAATGSGQSPGLFGPSITLVTFTANTRADVALFVPPGELSRPQAAGELVVTSACRSRRASGVLGLGYARRDNTADVALRDAGGHFHDIRLRSMPFYDTAKRCPRGAW